MKKEYKPLSLAEDILSALNNGILLTTKADDEVNTMVISWGTMGIEWGKPVFTTFVRESRHTYDLLMKNGEFTINVPLDGELSGDVFEVCGSESGRDVNKIEKCHLTLVDGEEISVPGIQECPITLECKVIYQQRQDVRVLLDAYRERCYPEVNEENAQNHDSVHTAFYGEIVKAYIID